MSGRTSELLVDASSSAVGFVDLFPSSRKRVLAPRLVLGALFSTHARNVLPRQYYRDILFVERLVLLEFADALFL